MKSWIGAIFAAILLILFAVDNVYASGPGQGGRRVRLDNAPAGPYRLRVITSPTPPVIEQLYLEVRVTDADSDELVLDADVLIIARPLEQSGPTIEAMAIHAFAPIPMDYAAHLPVDSVGLWEIQIHVHAAQGEGTVSFIERITSGKSLGPALAVAIPIAALAALGFIFIWLQRNSAEGDD
jgi:hypothetical protein